MQKEFYTIGEVSEIMDMTVKALRFYDRIGLLKPHHVDESNHYRYYHIDQFIYLDIIKMVRNLDISPKALIPYFKNKDTEGLMLLLNHQKELTRKKIKTMESIANGIEQFNHTICNAKNAQTDNEIYSRFIPDRHAMTVPYDKEKAEKEYFLDYYKLNITVSRHRFINTYEPGLLFLKDAKEDFYPAYLFTTISEPAENSDYYLISSGNYLCVRYSWDNVEQQQIKLQQHIIKHNLTPLEVVQVELLTDLFPEYHTEIFELQVKV